MTKLVSGTDGLDDSMTDVDFAATNPTPTPAGVLASGIARLVVVRETMRARQLLWSPGSIPVDATEAGIGRLKLLADELAVLQLGRETYAYNTPVTFTGEITGSVMTITAAPNGVAWIGNLITGTGVVPPTFIIRYLTGVGGTGTYEVSTIYDGAGGNPPAVSSTTLTIGGWNQGYYLPGDGIPLYFEGADGVPYPLSANELRGALVDEVLTSGILTDTVEYIRTLMSNWNDLYDDLQAAYATVGTDQNKIDAMKVVIDSFDDTANWPSTTIG